VAVGTPKVDQPGGFVDTGAVYLYSIFGQPDIDPGSPPFTVTAGPSSWPSRTAEATTSSAGASPSTCPISWSERQGANAGPVANAGTVSIYRRTTLSSWDLLGVVEPTNEIGGGDAVGSSVALLGRLAMGGAPTDRAGGVVDSGAMFVWDVDGLDVEILLDGFESGDLSRWTSRRP